MEFDKQCAILSFWKSKREQNGMLSDQKLLMSQKKDFWIAMITHVLKGMAYQRDIIIKYLIKNACYTDTLSGINI